jgi:hypothetical protein
MYQAGHWQIQVQARDRVPLHQAASWQHEKQLKGFVRDAEIMNLPPSIREWSNKMAGDIDDADLREDFRRIQVKLSE